ncbi:site-2 protease family protein [Streptomyces aurantiacus]|uniref:Putative zinc metalloprotease n=1 Tax=Streptomyces aurantiacus JA 4570 TaxID=1286094 RepID=S4A4K6_9ACTN|nr:site-2 protease family protein [Streptomyces aurantiacus]EPH45630.1 putative zinc metalloprotease [Streptomyces aurantiacus JA 4570]
MDESGGSGRPQSEQAPARAEDAPAQAEDAPSSTSRPAPDHHSADDPRPAESPTDPEAPHGTGEDPGAPASTPRPGTPDHRGDAAPDSAEPPAADHPAPARPTTPVSVRKEHPADGDGDADRRDSAPPARAHAHHSGEPPKEQPKNPGGGLLMGRPFGVPVYVAPSWFLVAALITWVFGGQLDRVLPELGSARYLVSLFFAVAFYASVLVHELAHTVAALRFKLPVRRIQLQFFGGVSEIEKESETPGREFVLAFVGPLLSLVLAGVFYAGMRAVEPGTVPGVLLAGLMISNLIVAAFNLLPGLPLDGGRMLRAVVWKITGKPMSGTIAAAWVGRALAISVLVGLPILNQSGALGGETQDIGGMDTVTDALLAAILAAIIWTGAGNSLRMARLREHLPELRARALTRRAVPVETDTPLSEALRRANAAGARALVVVDPDGDPLSVVREAAIVGVPEHRRPWVAVSGLAQDITEGMRIPAELAGEELLDRLRSTPATEYLVVETSGEIYGVLSAADVERAFVKAMARPN